MSTTVSAQVIAEIQPQDPETIVLGPDNSYEVDKEFDGTNSDGDIQDYEWNLVEEGETSTGPFATFTFERDFDSSNEIKLTVFDDEGNSDVDSIIQNLEDVPEVEFEITGGSNEVEGEGNVNFEVTEINNSFNDPIEYSWTVEDLDEEDPTGEQFSHTFEENDQGNTYTVTVNASDQVGHYGTYSIDIEVLEDPEFEIDITSYDDEVDAGNSFGLDVDIENIGGYTGGSQDINFTVEDEDNEIVETEDITIDDLDAGETVVESFDWSTNEGDEGNYDATVEALDDGNSDSVSFDIIEPNEDNDDEDEENGAGGAPPGDEEDDEDEDDSDEEEFDEEELLDADEGGSQEIGFEDSPVTSVNIQASDGEILVGEVKSRSSDERPDSASEDPDGSVYRYMEYETDIDSGSISNVEFSFEVSKDWIEDQNIANETVSLNRYENGWEKLDTTLEDEDEDNFYYSADREGFSTYSITGDEMSSDIEVTELSMNTVEVDPGEEFEINITVENTGNRQGTQEINVEVGDQTLSSEFSLSPGDTDTESFTTSVQDSGTFTVTAGDQETDLNVRDVDEDSGFSWLIVLAFFLILIALLAIGLLYMGKEEKIEPYIGKLNNKIAELTGSEPEEAEEFEWDGFND